MRRKFCRISKLCCIKEKIIFKRILVESAESKIVAQCRLEKEIYYLSDAYKFSSTARTIVDFFAYISTKHPMGYTMGSDINEQDRINMASKFYLPTEVTTVDDEASRLVIY